MTHDINVGDLFIASWGYDQTNINAYQAVRTTPKMVVVREVETKHVSEDRVKAVMDAFKGPTKNYFPAENGSIKVFSFARAYPRDWADTFYETPWYAGH